FYGWLPAASSQELDAGAFGSGALQPLADELRAILNQFPVFEPKCRREVTVDIEFASDLAVHKDGHHNLRLGFERAGKIARVLHHVVHYHRLSRRSRGAADALV